MFDSTLTRELDADRIEQIWEMLPQQFGEFSAIDKTTIDTLPGLWLTQTVLLFKKAKMSLDISFNAQQQIAGLFIKPVSGYTPPTYINTLAFTERKLSFGKSPYIINGTLSIPFSKQDGAAYPLVIIVHGSGPVDRDMTTGNNKPYKDLAWALASKGIAVFRYDKRTYSYGAMLAFDEAAGKHTTIKEEYLDDVALAIKTLRKHPSVDPSQVYILGHSQGGSLAPLIAKENKQVAGIILAAGGARSMQDALLEQLSYLYDSMDISKEQRAQIDKLKRGALYAKRNDLTLQSPIDSLPFAKPAYWISLNQYDVAQTFVQLKKPALVLQGERDYQVTQKEFNLWKEWAKNRKTPTSFKSYPKLNHHFIEGSGKSTSNEYMIKGNVPEYVADDIASWIKEQKH